MNFDTPMSRDGTCSVKFENRGVKFCRDDVLPLWVADMDLPTSPAIQQALLNRIKHPIYGYTTYCDDYFASIVRWMDVQHDWHIKREWVVPVNNIVSSLALCVEVLTKPDEKVLIQPPIYPPFYSTVENQKRGIVENQLLLQDGHYEIDFDDFEARAKEASVFLFCSPHNPTGRVWRREELERIVEICIRFNVIIISDEVHADLTVGENRHIPIATIPGAEKITITLNAPSKTFNVAGIVTAYAIIENDSLRRRFESIFHRYFLKEPSLISMTATIAAYTQSDAWLEALKHYLNDNLRYLCDALQSMPAIKPMPMESTFLLWLDCRGLGLDDAALEKWFVYDVGLGLNTGVSFGSGGEGFMRLNYACAKSNLEKAIELMDKNYPKKILSQNM